MRATNYERSVLDLVLSDHSGSRTPVTYTSGNIATPPEVDMRRLTVSGLIVLLIALAGCNSSSPSSGGFKQWSASELKDVAVQFNPEPKSNSSVPGEQMPLEFTDSEGRTVDLKSFRGKSNVVLVVVRGMLNPSRADFCHGCLAQAHVLSARNAEFAQREAQILLLFPNPNERLDEFLAQAKVAAANGNPKAPFPVLLDEQGKAVAALGIKDRLQNPSTFILDKQGDVVFAYVGNGNPLDRPGVDALLAQLDKLKPKK